MLQREESNPTSPAGDRPRPTFLKDYRPPPWLVPEIDIRFDLDPEDTLITATLKFRRNPRTDHRESLLLNGEGLRLEGLRIDGRDLQTTAYETEKNHLIIPEPPADEFELTVRNRISPIRNEALEGLYMSGGKYCTQNEPEGFRHITYFPDRPDVMSSYTTTIVAPRTEFPVLLSNGNPVERRDLEEGRHLVVWRDPFAKPCYLFALVAGDLGVIRDSFRTRSGREVALEIYTDRGQEERCLFAMESLKKAMAWDEEVFGLEYDLDIYMIVAVEDFNFGAMENKGLNIFNSRLVLADTRTATDDIYESIQGVVAHEYFHNWTGNRVTCRDWFQLTLKEGLTVYRDQRFTADIIGRAVKRIRDVSSLRALQFPEDSGPMAHPIQPKSYIEINNFYTMTIYEKGAEVIRMIAALIGEAEFRRGLETYFRLHDGQAVTTEDFIVAMEQASGFDLNRFRLWYHEQGTPVVGVEEHYHPDRLVYEITLTQTRSEPAGEDASQPLLIPFRLGLLDGDGNDMNLHPVEHEFNAGTDTVTTMTLHFAHRRQTFTFVNVPEKPLPSLLREFSAPVRLEYTRDRKTLAFQFARDSDLFNRWDAGRTLFREVIDENIRCLQQIREFEIDADLSRSFEELLAEGAHPAFIVLALRPPRESEFTDEQNPADFENTHLAHRQVRRSLALAHGDLLLRRYQEYHRERGGGGNEAIARRRLKNLCLEYLMLLEDPEMDALCFRQMSEAENMSDETEAFRLLTDSDSPHRQRAIDLFYGRWSKESLVMNTWFEAQAASSLPGRIERVAELRMDPVFNIKNPNRVRSLLGVFSRNGLHFNESSGRGYALVADSILEIDAFNPGVAAGLTRSFSKINRLAAPQRERAREQLSRILEKEDLSGDTYEIAWRCLDA